MLSFYNIWAIARFEIKTLSRSWFLRIFTALAFILIFFYDLSVFTDLLEGFAPRMLYGMSSSLPYTNLLFFNIVQAVITVFLASDFLKRDKKLDTTEAIYIRSMTNSDYVLGKSLGIITIFTSLNICILLMALLFNIVGYSSQISLTAYFYYLLFMSIPTLIFIIGLSFLAMILIRNQAVTFILLLGYISTTLFYLGGEFYNLFDYTGFHVPMLYSDFIGFGDAIELILHRGMYVLFGFSFIFFTMYLFRRLPQSIEMRRLSIILAVVLFFCALFAGFSYVNKFTAGQELRSAMIETNKKYFSYPAVSVISNDIVLNHKGSLFECRSDLKVQNKTNESIDELIFSLNPGLKIISVTADGIVRKHRREDHIVIVTPPAPLMPGEYLKLIFGYSGSINDEASYLDVQEIERNQLKRIALYISQKVYSVLSTDYVLLTQENLWYPVPGVTYNPEAQFEQKTNFIDYSLTVKTKPGLTAISQGALQEENDSLFVFNPETPLPQLSLVIGSYEKRSIAVDSIQYSLYIKKDHNYFDKYLDEIGDTLGTLIKEVKQDYEREIGLEYSYPRFSIVEVPVQYTEYQRMWTAAYETVQPEMTFFPEQALNIDDADFKLRNRIQERWGNRGNQVILPRERQANQLKRLFRSAFLDGSASAMFRRGGGRDFNYENPFSAFPNYYSFVNNVSSADLPIINAIFEDYLKVENDNSTSPFSRFETGLTGPETALEKFAGKTLEQITSDTVNSRYMKELLKVKSRYLFTAIENEIGKTELKQLIVNVLNQNKYENITFDFLNNELINNYNLDMQTFVDHWYKNTELPGYFVSKVSTAKIIDRQRERYQVIFNITNPESIDGYVNLTFNPRRGQRGGRGRFGRGPENEEPLLERIVFVAAGTTKKIGIVLDESPGNLTINTLLSKNLPLQLEYNFDEFEEKKKAVPFDGEQQLDEMDKFGNVNEIIVDNEDPGFEITNPEQTSWLKKVLNFEDDDEDKYTGIRWWRAPRDWRAAIQSEAYGKFIHSVHFTRAGDGNIKVTWNADIKQSGYYDVYCNTVKPQFQFRRRDVGEEEYHYMISHDDGSEEVILENENAEQGWNMLGSFYFSDGPAKVELTNESPDGIILADAVKWVLRK
jgi:hypothetical protein